MVGAVRELARVAALGGTDRPAGAEEKVEAQGYLGLF
jgi:hypothetical protein